MYILWWNNYWHNYVSYWNYPDDKTNLWKFSVSHLYVWYVERTFKTSFSLFSFLNNYWFASNPVEVNVLTIIVPRSCYKKNAILFIECHFLYFIKNRMIIRRNSQRIKMATFVDWISFYTSFAFRKAKNSLIWLRYWLSKWDYL